MPKRYKRQIKTFSNTARIWTIGLIVCLLFLFFNDTGALKWLQLKAQKEQTNEEITTLLQHQIKLREEIQKLETDMNYLEQVAREKFMMVKPGEKLFRVVNTKTFEENKTIENNN